MKSLPGKCIFSKYIAARVNSEKRCAVEHVFQGPGWVWLWKKECTLEPYINKFSDHIEIFLGETIVKSTKVNFLRTILTCFLFFEGKKQNKTKQPTIDAWKSSDSLWYSTLTNMYTLQIKYLILLLLTFFSVDKCHLTVQTSKNQKIFCGWWFCPLEFDLVL